MSVTILEYMPGTKGDFLNNRLLGLSSIPNRFYRHNLSITNGNLLKRYINHCTLNLGQFNKEDFLSVLKIVRDKNVPITCSHELKILSITQSFHLLKENGFFVKKILFEEKYYRTIFIESYIKNLDNVVDDNCQYTIDKDLEEKKLRINDANRAEVLHQKLKSKTLEFEHYYNWWNTSNLADREFLNYEDLYIKFNLNDDLFKNVDHKWFKSEVAKSWLPNKITLFGNIFTLSDYGYLQF